VALFTRLWQCFAGDDLQQEHELQAIAEVLLDVLDLRSGLAEVRVNPGSEGLEGKVVGIKFLFVVLATQH